jgi:hypothetical protein
MFAFFGRISCQLFILLWWNCSRVPSSLHGRDVLVLWRKRWRYRHGSKGLQNLRLWETSLDRIGCEFMWLFRTGFSNNSWKHEMRQHQKLNVSLQCQATWSGRTYGFSVPASEFASFKGPFGFDKVHGFDCFMSSPWSRRCFASAKTSFTLLGLDSGSLGV